MSGSSDFLFFNGYDANGDDGLWVSNGTAGGTHEITGVSNVYAGVSGKFPAGLYPNDITVVDGNVLFDGVDAADNSGLWVTDGLAAGTKELTGIVNASPNLEPSDLTLFGGGALFFGTDASGQRGLWETDGTAGGTKEVAAGVSGSELTIVNGAAYFVGADGGLWRTNGGAATEVFSPAAGNLICSATITVGTTTEGPYNFVTPSGGLQPYALDGLNGELLFGGSYQYTATQSGQTATITGVGLFAYNGTSFQLLSSYLAPSGATQSKSAGVVTATTPQMFNYISGGATFAYFQGGSTGQLYATGGTGTPVAVTNYFNPLYPVDLANVDGYLMFNGATQYWGGFDNANSLWLTGGQAANFENSGESLWDMSSLFTGMSTGDNASNSVPSNGLNPTDFTGLNDNLYFNGVDAAGFSGLWELPAAYSPTLPGVPWFSSSKSPEGVVSYALIGSGGELIVPGADPVGLDPTDMTVASIGYLSLSDAFGFLSNSPGLMLPSINNVIQDTAANIEAVTPVQFTALASIGVVEIVADASLVFSVLQALALEEPIVLSVPTGDTVTVSDTAAAIESLTPTQIAALPQLGFTGITAADASVVLIVAQAAALEAAGLAVAVPSGDTVSIADIAAQIETLTASQIAALPAAGVTAIAATDAAVVFSIAQVTALNGIALTMPSGDLLSVADSAANIEALTASQAAVLKTHGVTRIAATDTSVVFPVTEALLFAGAPFTVSVPKGDTLVVADTAAAIVALTPAQIVALPALGVTAIQTSGHPVITIAQAVALENASLPVIQAPQSSLFVTVSDTAAKIEALTAAEIALLPAITANVAGILTGITATDASVTLTVAQAVALQHAAIAITVPAGDTVTIADTAAHIETLTAPEITAFLVPSPTISAITATDASVVLSIAQAMALKGVPGGASLLITPPAGDSVSVADSAAAIEALTPGQLQQLGVTAIAATDAPIVFSAAQAEAAIGHFHVSAPAGDTVSISDTAANIQSLLNSGFAGGVAQYAGITTMTATDASLIFTVAEVQALEAAHIVAGAPAGDHVTLTDIAADIETLTQPQIAALPTVGVTAVTFAVADALTLESAAFALTPPAGVSVSVVDTAADIEAMTAAQIAALVSIGVTNIVASDTSVVLTVAQALALEDPIVVSAPPGQTVTIADTEAAIDTLTPAQIGALTTVGISGIAIASLTGAAPITIEGGITLTVTGAIAAAQTITFLGLGGVLRLPDPTAMAGTISGFAPPDTIDLTGAAYDPSAFPSLGGNNLLTVSESSGTYDVQLDPAQVYLTSPDFQVGRDAAGGTAITMSQSAVVSYTPLGSGFTAYDAVVANGGEIDVQPNGVINDGTVGGGGLILVENGGALDSAFINSGGIVEFAAGSQDIGTIDFSATGGLGTGTLRIDDTTMPPVTIAGFAQGDRIDLTAIPHVAGDTVSVVAGDTLQLVTSVGTYDLALSPDVDLSHDFFYLSNDNAAGTNVGVINDLLPRTLSWTGNPEVNFANAVGWDDVTNSMNPAIAPPNGVDTVEFDTVDGVFTGIATVAAVEVGVAGSGVLELASGATLVAGSLDAGIGASDVAQVGLTGDGTKLTVTGAATVADDGTGVLSVLSGATLNAASLTIGALGDSSGAAVVSGAGSVVRLSGALDVGTAQGTGDLTIGPGAMVQAPAVFEEGQVVLEGGLLDPTVQLINQGQTAGGFGTIAAGDIVDEGAIQAGGNKASQKLLIVQGTVLGGGTLTVNGTLPGSVPAGILQINAGGTLELSGAVLNAAATTFTDNLTPTGTYTVTNSVVDVNFVDSAGALLLDDIAGFGGTITTYQAGDSFVVTGGTLSGLGVNNGNTLTVSDSGGHAGAGGVDRIIFGSAVSAAGFNIVNNDTIRAQVACFAAGTRIETEYGAVTVEALAIGGRVRTLDGACEPIIWIGQRTVNCERHPRPTTVCPVRIRRGAFGGGTPWRDLFLSPDHAVYVNDALVPVKLLINGTSIAQVKRRRPTYFHVELSRHAVIFAEGLTVESYLNTGDRADFEASGATIRLFPDFTPRTTLAWQTRAAAPLVMTGEELAAARRSVVDFPPATGTTRRRSQRA